MFFLPWQKEMREIAAGIYNLLKAGGLRGITVSRFMAKLTSSDQEVEANLSTMFQSVRDSRQYWLLRSSELKCMLRDWGSLTLFLTFSCAKYESPEIGNYLRKVNDVPSSYLIARLCPEVPISVSRKFSQKFNTLFNMILKREALGTVTHFIKKEYQARGTPHYHLLQDAPVIGKDRPDDVLKITCRIPQEESNPELHRLVNKYQLHKCSAYCKVRKKFNGIYVTRYKFAFPCAVHNTATLNPIEECLKSRNKKIYLLLRADHEVRVNDYNPLLLLLWKANMDIQFTAEALLALAHYVS